MVGCQPRTPAQRRAATAAGRPLRVGTDCSGLDTPIAALEEILLGRNRQIHHVFSSELDPKTLKILLHNFTPDYHCTDVARRALRPGQGNEHPAADQLDFIESQPGEGRSGILFKQRPQEGAQTRQLQVWRCVGEVLCGCFESH